MSEPARVIGHTAMQPIQSEASAIMNMIERVARDPSVDLERMERLLQMREQMIAREAKMAFDEALSQAQVEFPVVERKGKIEVRKKDSAGDRTGAVQQSTPYARWEDINDAIKPVMASHGFALSFRVDIIQDRGIKVTAILSHAKGHREETSIILQHDSTGSKNAVQAVGSSVSYGKRYCAAALLNLTSRLPEDQDDDGSAAGGDGPISEDQLAELIRLADEVAADKIRLCTYLNIESLAALPARRYTETLALIERKMRARRQ